MNKIHRGLDGTPFLIKKVFTSYDQMTTAFKQGPNYTEVEYGQYVMIHPNNRHDNNYGKIFRRGYNYENAAGGAEEIFTASGSSGYLPTISNLSNASATGVQSGDIALKTINDINNEFGENEANQHQIITKYNTIQTNDGDNTTLALNFIIPRPHFQFTTRLADATYSTVNNNVQIVLPNEVQNVDKTQEEPFDHRYTITIPVSSHGGNLKNISISESNNHFQLNYSKTSFNRFTEGNVNLYTIKNNTLQPKNLEHENNNTTLSINNWQGKCKIYKNNNNLYLYFIVTEQKPIPNTFTYNIINSGTINISFPYMRVNSQPIITNTSQTVINQQITTTLTYNATNIGNSSIAVTADGQLIFNLPLSNLSVTLGNDDIIIGDIIINNLTIMKGAIS